MLAAKTMAAIGDGWKTGTMTAEPDLPRNQQELIDYVTGKLAGDSRVRGLWLTGSFGRGSADRFSDVDTLAAVAPDELDAFVSDWPEIAEAILKPILIKQVGNAPVFSHVLPGWLRFDLVVAPVDSVPTRLDSGSTRELINRDALELGPSTSSDQAAPVDRATVLGMTEEFLRILGLLTVVIGRGEWVTAASGAANLRLALTTLLRMRVEGGRPTGALHLSKVLDPELIERLEALPAVHADRDSAIELHLACAHLFLPVARELLGADYPQKLEDACRDHLELELGIPRTT